MAPRVSSLVCIACFFCVATAHGDEPQAEPSPAPAAPTAKPAASQDAVALAKKAQNPGAVMTSVPFQFNFLGGIGPHDRVQMKLNVQPVIPIPLTQKLAVLWRPIVPIIVQPPSDAPGDPPDRPPTAGFGDITVQGFVAYNDGPVTLGGGFATVLPTATSLSMGGGKFAVGPAAVGVLTLGPFVVGGLVYWTPSVAGSSERAGYSVLTMQPLLNANIGKLFYLTFSPLITIDFESGNGVLPLGAGVGKVLRFGPQMVNCSLAVYGDAFTPTGAAKWETRLQIQLLFPG